MPADISNHFTNASTTNFMRVLVETGLGRNFFTNPATFTNLHTCTFGFAALGAQRNKLIIAGGVGPVHLSARTGMHLYNLTLQRPGAVNSAVFGA